MKNATAYPDCGNPRADTTAHAGGLRVPLSTEEVSDLNRAAQGEGQDLAAWARTTLMRAVATPAQLVLKAVRLDGEALTQTQIARRLGIQQPYVTKLLKIGTLDPEILTHWADAARSAEKPVSTDNMWPIADLATGEQRAEYDRQVEAARLSQQRHHEKLQQPRGSQNRRRQVF